MEVTTTRNGSARYARIETPTRSLTILLPDGRDDAASLRDQAAEWEAKAQHLLSMAADATLAAGVLDARVIKALRAALIAKSEA